MGSDSSRPYNPLDHSVVQALMMPCTYAAFETDDFHNALLQSVLREIERVFWNRNQRQWDDYEDAGIEGVVTRPYHYCYCEGDDHDDDCKGALPNFEFDGVHFHWYKRPGRGMSVNVDMNAGSWREWHARVMAVVKAACPLAQERAQREKTTTVEG